MNPLLWTLIAMSDQEVAAQIRAHAPSGARAYFLSNYAGRYPTQGGFSLDPISMPMGLQPGEYRVGFLAESASNLPLQPRNLNNPHPSIRITNADSQSLAVAPSQAEKEKPVKQAKERDPIDEDPEHLRNRVDFEATKMVDQTITTKHLIAKRLDQARELGEHFVLTRAHRQEWEQVMRVASQNQRETLAHQRENLAYQRTMMKHAQEMTDMLMETTRRYAQPPDPQGTFTGMFGQVLTLITSLVNGGKDKGEKVFDAILGSDDDDATKLQAIKKKLKLLQQQVAEKEAEQATKKPRTTRRRKKRDTVSEARSAARKKPAASKGTKKTPSKKAAASKDKKGAEERGSQEGAKAGSSKKTRKQLPAKGGS